MKRAYRPVAAGLACAVFAVVPAGLSGSGSEPANREGHAAETAAVLGVTRDVVRQAPLSLRQTQLDPAVTP